MKVQITIPDDLINKVKILTNSSTASEAVNIALKDWLVIFRMRELNRNLSKRKTYINNIQRVRGSDLSKQNNALLNK
jgi:Arc/MetJ family transcription regulator